MSNTVDQRIVEMRFDNNQFESGIKTSISTLDRLKQKLNFKDSIQSFSELDRASKNIHLERIADGVDTISSKFSALGILGVTTLANIANSAINTSKQIASMFTIEPVRSGMQEYETQLNSVQTVLANTQKEGATIKDVNRALNELNLYADKTIYNFTEMTRNIGTFTAAGVDLKTSVSAIKGISNLAAVSGSSSQQASTAMYQLSQALAAGTVKLQDWNSVVNAGMGGQVFQDSLMETARVHGIAIDDMVAKEGSFRETLSNGWLSSEILTETLAKFTGDLSEAQLKQMGYNDEQIKGIMKMGETANDAATKVKTFTQLVDTLKEAAQSGWTQTWQILIGDFEEAKELWTGVSDVLGNAINESANARNELLSKGLSSGWNQLLNAGIQDEQGYIDSIREVAKKHGYALDDMIEKSGSFEKTLKSGWLTGDMLSESLTNLANKTRGLSDEELANLGYTKEQVDELQNLEKQVQNGTVSMDDFAKKFTMMSGRENIIKGLANAFDALVSIITPIRDAFRQVFEPIKPEQLYDMTERFKNFTATLELSHVQALHLKNTFKGLFTILKFGINIVKTALSLVFAIASGLVPLGNVLLSITSKIGYFIQSFDLFQNRFSSPGKSIASVSEKMTGAFSSMGNVFKSVANILKPYLDIIINGLNRVGIAFNKVINSMSIDNAINVLVSGTMVSAFLKLSGLLDDLGEGFGNLIKNFEKIGKGGAISNVLNGVKDSLLEWQNSLKAESLIKIAWAIGVLALSLAVLSSIKNEDLSKSLSAMGTLFAELLISMAALQKISGGIKTGLLSVVKLTQMMIGLSAAMLILASSVKVMSSIEPEKLAVGLAGLGGAMAEMVASTAVLSKVTEKSSVTVASMLGLASAIYILSKAVQSFADIDQKNVVQGLLSMAAVLAEVIIFQKLTEKAEGNFTSVAVGMGLISVAMLTFAEATAKMGAIDKKSLIKGLGGIAVALTSIALAIGIMPTDIKMISVGAGMILLSEALKRLTTTIYVLGSLSTTQLYTSIASLGGSLHIVTLAVTGMSRALPGAVAMVAVSGALSLLAPALKSLGELSLQQLGMALLSLSGALLVLGVGAAVLTPAVPVLAALAAVFTGLGVAIASIGAGSAIASVATSLASLSGVVGTLSATATIEGFKAMMQAIIGLIPAIVKAFADGFVTILKTVANSGKEILNAVTTILTSILQAITKATPDLVKCGLTILMSVLRGIRSHISEMTTIGIEIIELFLNAIASKMQSLVDAAMKLILTFINTLSVSISKYGPELGKAMGKLGIAMIQGLIGGLLGGVGEVVKTVWNLGKKLITTMEKALDSHSPSKEFIKLGKNVDTGLAKGISDNAYLATDSVKDLGDNLVDSLSDYDYFYDTGYKSGSNFNDGLNDSLNNTKIDSYYLNQRVTKTGKDLTDSIGDGAKSKESSLANRFGNVVSNVATKIGEYGDKYKSAGSVLGSNLLTGMSNVLEGSSSIIKKLGALSEKNAASSAAGESTSDGFANGINQNSSEAVNAVVSMSDQILAALDGRNDDYTEAGKNLITAFIKGVNKDKYQAVSTVSKVGADSADKLNGYYNSFHIAGKSLVQGFANGISANIYIAEAQAAAMARAAYDAAMSELDAHSPSKKFIKVGSYVAEGFASGIDQNASLAEKSSGSMAAKVITAAKTAISKVIDSLSDDGDFEPVIRPVIDTSRIQNGLRAINTAFNKNQVMRVSDSIQGIKTTSDKVQSNNPTSGNVYQFTQNNYSPKALSRLEIYRQTRNQFSELKGLV